MNNCSCGCKGKTNGIWKTGHNLRLNPLPQNLKSFINGKKGTEHPNWKGGRRIVDGYMYIYHPFHPNSTKQGYVCEHRLIMEKKLKRYLRKDEVVHHKDNNPLNNNIDNLILVENQGEHNRFHVKERNQKGQFVEVINQ